MKNKKTQIKDYQAEDYTFAVIKEFIEKNKKDEIFKTNHTKDFQYRPNCTTIMCRTIKY